MITTRTTAWKLNQILLLALLPLLTNTQQQIPLPIQNLMEIQNQQKNHVKTIIVENVIVVVATAITTPTSLPTRTAQRNAKNIQNQTQNPIKRAPNQIQNQNQKHQNHVRNQNLEIKQKYHQIVLLQLMIYIK